MVQGSTECAIEGCGGSTPRWSALCALHRDRLAAGERLTDGERLPRVCSVEGCDRGRPLRRGLCSACYARAARAGALPPRHPRVPKPRPQCAIDGCERRADGSRGCAGCITAASSSMGTRTTSGRNPSRSPASAARRASRDVTRCPPKNDTRASAGVRSKNGKNGDGSTASSRVLTRKPAQMIRFPGGAVSLSIATGLMQHVTNCDTLDSRHLIIS